MLAGRDVEWREPSRCDPDVRGAARRSGARRGSRTGTRNRLLVGQRQPEVITLCGSIRFAAEHLAAHTRLSLEGRVVLLPALPVPGEELLPADVKVLAAVHRQKIAMSHRVHIVNPGGYVGETTASEVAYAEALGKEVTYEHNVS